MKKNKLFILIGLITIILGCTNPNQPSSNNNNSGSDSNSSVRFEAGWYKYSSGVNNNTFCYYIKFNSNKTIERMGNDTTEFTGAGLSIYKDNTGFSFENLVKASSNSNTILKKISDSELPGWAKTSTTSGGTTGGSTGSTGTGSGNGAGSSTGSSSTPTKTEEEIKLEELVAFLKNFIRGKNEQKKTQYTSGGTPYQITQTDEIIFSNVSSVQKDVNNKPYITVNIAYTNQTEEAMTCFGNSASGRKSIRLYFSSAFTDGDRFYYITDYDTDFTVDPNCEIRLNIQDISELTYQIYKPNGNFYQSYSVTYKKLSTTSSGSGSTTTTTSSIAPSFIGTWKTTQTGILYDTVQFNSNGTGSTWKQGYTGSNTFTWTVATSTKLNVTNTTQGSSISGEVTYLFNSSQTTLTLTGFMGYSGSVTFSKQN